MKADLDVLPVEDLRSLYVELAVKYSKTCSTNPFLKLTGDAAELKRLCTQELVTVPCPTPAEWVETARSVLFDITVGVEIYRNNHRALPGSTQDAGEAL